MHKAKTVRGNSFVKENYTKIDTTITMRDGVKLYTVIYVPKDNSEKYPILMERTPYSVGLTAKIIMQEDWAQ